MKSPTIHTGRASRNCPPIAKLANGGATGTTVVLFALP